MRTRSNLTGEYNGGKCVTSERRRDAVMIPFRLKHTQLTFKFNEHMLGKKSWRDWGDGNRVAAPTN